MHESFWAKGNNFLSVFVDVLMCRATGIFPLDGEKYLQDHFDQRLLKHYKNWLKLGKLEDIMEDLLTAVVIPAKGPFNY